MGVINRAKQVSGFTEREDGTRPYVCLACETPYFVQHHTCPVCGSFDLRRTRWVVD